MSAGGGRRWRDALSSHAAAVAEFAERAAAVPASAWRTPLPGRAWSPAHETLHLVLVYEAAVGELRGGPGMRQRLRGWQRALLRWFTLPRILRTGRMPSGVQAPREIRPGGDLDEQPVLIERFRARAAEFDGELARVRAASPERRLTHPFFGTLSLAEAARLAAVHVRHHSAHLDTTR